MNRRDEGKASLVEFLRSIKFAQESSTPIETEIECPTHFAHFEQSTRRGRDSTVEDQQLVRSAN